MKKLIGIFALIAGVFTLTACDFDEADLTDGDTDDVAHYMHVDINPEVEFLFDEEENVVSVSHLNEDAETVLAELDLDGKPAQEAFEAYLEEAIELGYIDFDEAEENFVRITGDEFDEAAEAFGEQMRERAQAFLDERGINGVVERGAIDDELRELAEEYDISVGRMKMIQQVVNIDDDLELEEAVELEQSDIMQILRENHQSIREEYTDEMRENARERSEQLRKDTRERMEERRDELPPFFDDFIDEEDNDEEDTEGLPEDEDPDVD